jgi:large subunit ribosomal protein L17
VRHQVAGRKLGRDVNSRKALLNNLASALFVNGEITTTLAKAKFVQGYAEKSITIAKKNRLAAKRK